MGGDDADKARRVAAAATAVAQRAREPPLAAAMRAKAAAYAGLGLPATARFLADKAAAASRAADDVLRLARVHASAGQHRRARHVLDAARLPPVSLPARLLAAQCAFEVADLDGCLALLGEADADAPPPRAFANGESESPLFRRGAGAANGGKAAAGLGGGGDAGEVGGAAGTAAAGAAGGTAASADTPEVRAALCVMRGRVYEELENMERAAWWYKRALAWDVYCYEAFTRLVDAGLVSPDEAAQFCDELSAGRGASASPSSPAPHGTAAAAAAATPPSSPAAARLSSPQGASLLLHAQADARTWMCAFYRVRVDRAAPLPPAPSARDLNLSRAVAPADAPATWASAAPPPQDAPRLVRATAPAADTAVGDRRMSDNVDVLAVRAGRLFASLDFDECARLTRAILERDPFVEDRVTVVHLAALVELDERHELFVLAHRLVDSGPRRGISWMAVGYYYFACGKYELARRYLQKATGVDPRLGPAWLASGHAFAAQDESDQAMAAYRTASRLFPGAQLPLLFMGMEYARQSSPVHATSFFQSAREACLSDPAPRHELGVIAYRSGDLPAAVAYFKAALSLWEASDGLKDFVSHGGRRAEAEEATLFNLGHCYRRLREFERAKQCYERALSLRPRSASTCCALGMTLHALGDHPSAVAMYHRALRHNPEDTMSVVGLDRALHDMTTTSPV